METWYFYNLNSCNVMFLSFLSVIDLNCWIIFYNMNISCFIYPSISPAACWLFPHLDITNTALCFCITNTALCNVMWNECEHTLICFEYISKNGFWLIWELYDELPKWCPKRLYHFMLLPAVYKGSSLHIIVNTC